MARAALFALCLLCGVASARAAAPEPAAWLATQWGMDAAALDAAVPGLTVLAPPWRYGSGLRAPRAQRRAEFLGLPFRALYQTDADGRLAQILFERGRSELRAHDADRALETLRVALGPEDRLCLIPARRGAPASAEAIWSDPDGVLHLSWVDFGVGDTVADLAGAERQSLLRAGEVEAAEELIRRRPWPSEAQSARPHRLTIRWRDPMRPDLASRVCPPLPVPRP